MLEQLTSKQVSEWKAYDRLDPVGKWRDELSIGSLMALIVNMAREILHDPKKGKVKYVKPDDFMLDWGGIAESEKDPSKEQSPEEMEQAVINIAKAFGAEVKERKKR